MTKWIVGGAIAALAAGAALAQMPMRMEMKKIMMPAAETRADVEARVKAHFAEVDSNKDGAITREETAAFRTAQAQKMRAEMRDAMFGALDADKNGSVSRDEFNAHHNAMGGGMKMEMGRGMMAHSEMMAGAPGGPTVKRIVIRREGGDLTRRADANRDGKVTQAEARTAALAAFDKADANKDGTLSAEERMASMKTMSRKHKGDRRHD